MPEAVIVSALRTPIGTATKGTLRDTDAYRAGRTMWSARRSPDLDPAQVDDVILGEGLYGGGVVARHAAITAGLTPGARSGQQSALRGGSGGGAERGGKRAGGHGSARHRRWRELGVHVAAVAAAGGRRDGRLVPADPPGPARRAQHGHVDHRGLERRRQALA